MTEIVTAEGSGWKLRKEMVCIKCAEILDRDQPVTGTVHSGHVVAALDVLVLVLR